MTADGRVLGQGRSDYMKDSVQATIADAGVKATPLKEWCVDWVADPKLRDDLASSTLYLTLEPSPVSKGEDLPSVTKLIQQVGIPNVVIGCPYPVPELAYFGATALHKAGTTVRVLQPTDPLNQECLSIIPEFTELANSKVRCMISIFYCEKERWLQQVKAMFLKCLSNMPDRFSIMHRLRESQESNLNCSKDLWAISIAVLSIQTMLKLLHVVEMPLERI